MGYAPAFAIPKAAKKAGIAVGDIDVIELNEAFAAQAVAVARDVDLDPERLNPTGGAIALGHPVGATGSRLLVTALHELERRNASTAFISMCCGSAIGTGTILERL